MEEWDGTEAEALEDQSDHGAQDDFDAQEAEENYHRMRTLYDSAKVAKTGAKIRCPGCGKAVIKTTYNKVFCSNQRTTARGVNSCKDFYWNTVNPRGLGAREEE